MEKYIRITEYKSAQDEAIRLKAEYVRFLFFNNVP